MKRWILALMFLPAGLWSQDDTSMETEEAPAVGVGGVVDLAYTAGHRPGLNSNTLGDQNFNKIRAITNFQFQQGDRLRADIEVLYDDQAADKIRLQGAFVTFFNLPDERLNLMVGKIPNLFGNFAKREFSDVNPLIGQPLMRQHRTALDWVRLWDNREQIILKQRRQQFQGQLPIDVYPGATPVVYDARWDFGAEFFGNFGDFEYQVGATDGSISNPEAGSSNDGKQFLGRLAYTFGPGFKLGASGAINGYLSRPKTLEDRQVVLESGKEVGEYQQRAAGVDVEASYRYLIVFSEFVYSEWDAAVKEGKLSLWSAYVDAKYKLHPRVYVAARYDVMKFGRIENPDTGQKETWDYDVQRIETGVGYRITRGATVKLVGQFTKFDKSSGVKLRRLAACQLSVPF